jgi:hypothetical protein
VPTFALASVTWRVLPTRSPALVHFCRRCGGPQDFRHDGCFRVNANGRRLDIWLRHACERCGQTWHVPIAERVPVNSVDGLSRFERDDAALLDHWSWALARRYPTRPATDVIVEASAPIGGDAAVALEMPWPVKVRVDRLVARALGISRSAVGRRVVERRVLRQKAAHGMTLTVRRCLSSPPGD